MLTRRSPAVRHPLRPFDFVPRAVLVPLRALLACVPVVLSAQPAGVPKGAKRVKTPDSVLAKLPPSPKVPTSDDALLAERDKRAQQVLGYLSCMERTLRAARSGTLGQVRQEWQLVCVPDGSRWRAVYGTLTPTGLAVQAQAIVPDLPVGAGTAPSAAATAVRVARDPFDTTRVAAALRAQRRALSVAPTDGNTVFAVLPQPTFVELWFVPAPQPARPTVGGDSIIQMAVDGARELGHTSRAPARRAADAQPRPGGGVLIASREERLPLVTELLAARTLLASQPVVQIRTARFDATLTRRAGTWTLTPR